MKKLLKFIFTLKQPGEVLSLWSTIWRLIKIKIENMRQQHSDIVGEGYSKEAANVKKEVTSLRSCNCSNG